MTISGSEKKRNLFFILSGIFLTNALLAEIVGVKIFSLERTFGANPVNFELFSGANMSFNLTAGVILWPVVFITTDIINEYFGRKGVKKISFATVAFISYMFIVIFIITKLAPADFWLKTNEEGPDGNNFNVNFAFNKLFLQSAGIIIGSLIAFLIGQLLDVTVFHYLRRFTGADKIWLRATGSTLVSQLIDSFIVLYIAFILFAPANSKWTYTQLLNVGLMNYMYKFVVAIVLTPLLYLAHWLIDGYLGKDSAEELMEEAARNSR
ncbi:queuosine precursor transporter [Mangrovivirga sp. M17]|uniref:Probable queuosine precursor transporter n=1 Tax=Mangrovivirga halotolerans TaxID=2993936 RepID=A0ABT3RWB4_9BACT|nr:queuosine precursor transporter [Mangrovivirga halotolerans]